MTDIPKFQSSTLGKLENWNSGGVISRLQNSGLGNSEIPKCVARPFPFRSQAGILTSTFPENSPIVNTKTSMRTKPKHRQLIRIRSANSHQRSPVNQKGKLSPELQQIRTDAVQRWIRDARDNNISRHNGRGQQARGAFDEKFGYRCETVQILGSILRPSARFTPTAEAVEFLSSHRHPLHIICEIGDPVIFSDAVAAAQPLPSEDGRMGWD